MFIVSCFSGIFYYMPLISSCKMSCCPQKADFSALLTCRVVEGMGWPWATLPVRRSCWHEGTGGTQGTVGRGQQAARNCRNCFHCSSRPLVLASCRGWNTKKMGEIFRVSSGYFLHTTALSEVGRSQVWNTELRLVTSNFEQEVKEWPLSLHVLKCEVIRY